MHDHAENFLLARQQRKMLSQKLLQRHGGLLLTERLGVCAERGHCRGLEQACNEVAKRKTPIDVNQLVDKRGIGAILIGLGNENVSCGAYQSLMSHGPQQILNTLQQ